MRIGTSLFVLLLAIAAAARAKAEIKIEVHLEAFDLLGDPIREIPLGSDFELRAIVDDVRTSTPVKGSGGENLFGVFSAYVAITFDASNVSAAGPVEIDGFFDDLATLSATSPGLAEGGGATLSLSSPGSDEQLLFTLPLSATALGPVAFSPSYLNGTNEWLMYGELSIIPSEEVQFSDLEVTIVPEPAGFATCAIGLVAVALVARRRKTTGRKQNHDG